MQTDVIVGVYWLSGSGLVGLSLCPLEGKASLVDLN